MFRRIASSVQRLIASQSGGVAIQIGVGLVALIGMVGLGTEGTFLLYKHRQMQSAADSAALSGALALSQASPRDPVSEARAVAARLGFVHGAAQVAVTVTVPPASGSQTGNMQAVEVIISQPQDLSIMRMFGDDTVNVGTRSVAVQSDVGRFCILALDPTTTEPMSMSKDAMIPGQCGVAVNSISDTVVALPDNEVNFRVATRGGWSLANGDPPIGTTWIQPSTAITDPYADVALQTAPACTGQSGSGNDHITLNLTPGRFCDGWDFADTVVLNLAAGSYYIDTKLSLLGGVVVNGTDGVTLIVNGDYAMDFGDNTVLNLTAPPSGDYAGLVFFGRRDATSTVVQKFSNAVTMNIQGAIYFPNQILEIDNDGSASPSGCTHVIARTIPILNNAKLSNNCLGTGVRPISPPARLAE